MTTTSISKIGHIPKSTKIRLGAVRRMYIAAMLAGGLAGNTPEEVVETIFCRGLQKMVTPELMRTAGDWLDARKARKKAKRK